MRKTSIMNNGVDEMKTFTKYNFTAHFMVNIRPRCAQHVQNTSLGRPKEVFSSMVFFERI